MARTTNKAESLLTFSRASSGTALTKVAYGPELVTNGAFDTTSNWTLNTGWTIGGGQLSHAAGTASNATQNITLTTGKVYRATCDVIECSGGSGALQFRLGGTTTGVTITGSSVGQSVEVIYLADGNTQIAPYAGSGTTLIVDNISVKEVFYNDPTGTLKLISHPTNKPRVKYNANGVAKGLLIEEARTNLVTYSEDFTTSWTAYNSSITSNSDVAPDGTATADTLLGTAVVDTHAVRVAITTATSTEYAASCWFKKQNYSKCGVGVLSGTWQHVTYDFDADTLTTYGGATAKREIYGDFVRVVLLFSAGSTTTYLWLGPSSGSAVNNPFAFSAAGVEITFWGAQFETGSFPTSYIPTSGATATRSAEIASLSVSEFGYNQAQGALLMEFDTFSDGLSAAQYVLVGGNTSRFLYSNPGTLNWYSYDGATASNYTSSTLFNFDDTPVKVGYTEGGGSTAIYHDGNIGNAIQHETIFDNNPTVFEIGQWTGTYHLNGHIKSIKYYPVRLDDDKLKELTL